MTSALCLSCLANQGPWESMGEVRSLLWSWRHTFGGGICPLCLPLLLHEQLCSVMRSCQETVSPQAHKTIYSWLTTGLEPRKPRAKINLFNLKFFLRLLIGHECAHACLDMNAELKEQLMEVISPLLPCGSWRLSSSHKTWQQLP